MKKQENMPKNLKIDKKYWILLPIIVIFSIFVVLFQHYATFILPSSTQVSTPLATPQFSLYLISLNNSPNKISMDGIVEDFQQVDAGGYIWQIDDQYHIIYGCYEKENDATLVQKSLKQSEIDSQIIKLDYSSINFNGEYDSQSKKVLSRALKSFYITYLDLFDISASLDTNVYNDISARLAINNCYSNFHSAYTDFKTMFDEVEVLNDFNNSMQIGLKTLENLCAGKLINKNQTYSSLIKYRYCEFIANYYDFLKAI